MRLTTRTLPVEPGAFRSSILRAVEPQWEKSSPIYRQMRERFVAMILDGKLREGDQLPSVRDVAIRYHINPLTVLKAVQQLVDDRLIEKRRGKGLFVCIGAKAALLADERNRFLSQEWPRVCASCQRLGIDIDELPKAAATPDSEPAPKR
jgi:GntR family transcriptional regulator